MQENHQALKDRLDQCLVLLQNTTDMRAKSSLWKFYNNIRITWVELDKEMVECRRRKKVTQKYTSLEAQFNEYVNHFEQWATMAMLKFG